MTLTEFYDALARHDWFYEMSDDGRVWRAGVARQKELEKIAETSESHRDLFDRYSASVFSGSTWGTEKIERPERP